MMSVYKRIPLSPDACKLAFTSGGVIEPAVGDVMLGATSAAWAKITAIQVDSGTWAAGTAAGLLTLIGQQGVFVAENLNQVGGQTNIATIAADSICTAVDGAGTKILIAGHGLFTYENFCFIEGTHNYDGQRNITSCTSVSISIPVTHVLERFIGDELVYVGIPNGKDIAITYIPASSGDWVGKIPKNLLGVINLEEICIIVTIVTATATVVIKINPMLTYKAETDVIGVS